MEDEKDIGFEDLGEFSPYSEIGDGPFTVYMEFSSDPLLQPHDDAIPEIDLEKNEGYLRWKLNRRISTIKELLEMMAQDQLHQPVKIYFEEKDAIFIEYSP